MHAELDSPEAQVMAHAAAAAVTRRPLDPNVLHVCGKCKTFHKVEGGRLVKLSPAELFKLHVQQPKTMQRIEAMRVPTCAPGTAAGSLILCDEDQQ